jgi:hypothetical protein
VNRLKTSSGRGQRRNNRRRRVRRRTGRFQILRLPRSAGFAQDDKGAAESSRTFILSETRDLEMNAAAVRRPPSIRFALVIVWRTEVSRLVHPLEQLGLG